MFEGKMNQVLNENKRLLEQVINKDIVNIIMNSSVDNASVNVHECQKCLKLETGLLNKKDFIEKNTYDKLFRSYTTLEKHYISLEVNTQLNQEIFQRNNSVSNQSALTFNQYFELNELKAQSQEKDTVIRKLKGRNKSLSGNMNEDKVKKDIEEIKTINIELDHRLSRLRRLKGKDLVDNVVTKNTIAPKMLKIDVEPIAPRLLNNRTAHSDYLRHTQEQDAIRSELVEQGKSQNPLNNSLNSACKYTKRIQELLIIIRQTCPSINNSSDKLVAVTPKNKDKREYNRLLVLADHSLQAIQRKIRFSKHQHSKLNVNSELLCVKKFKEKSLEPTGKEFTIIGYTWRPTGRTFTIVENACPLTKITTTAEVPLRKPTSLETNTPKPIVTLVYLRKLRKSKTNVPALVRRIRTDNGTEFVNQNGVVERRNRTLIKAARTMLIYAKALLFLWAEAVATACYTQNRSIIRLRHGKTPYELLHDKLPDLSFFHVFGSLCYPTNDSENLGKLQPKTDIGIFIGYAPTKKAFQIYNRRTTRIIKTIHVDFDELTAMASEHNSLELALHEMTPATISLRLVPNPNIIPPEVIAPIAEVVAPEPAASTSSSSSTTVDQDAPSPNVAHMNNDPFIGIPILENDSKASSSSDVIPTIVHTAPPNSEHFTKWTKDHPLDNIISELERPVSTRLQLHEQALFCYYDSFLSSVEPKTYKDALTQACWIEAMQE
ncbi:retrovirus-related pol polyprotein from transposon TNT 1-94 [Tanacetum coccineum]